MGLLIDVELLIASIEERPAIWDKTSEAYKDRNLTKAAWHEICCILKNGFEELNDTEQHDFGKSIIAKWTNLRDTWVRSQKKAIEFNKSGAGLKNITKYRYHEKLCFLAKVFDNFGIYSPATEESNEVHEKNPKEDSTSAKSSNPIAKNNQPIASTSYFRSSSSLCASNKKRKCEDIETRLLKLLKKTEASQKPDPHLLFFESLLPSLMNLNEDQVLEFRIGVLALIKSIKHQNHPSYSSVPSNSSFQGECPDPLSNLPHPAGSSDPYFPQVRSASSHRFSRQSFHSSTMCTRKSLASSHLPEKLSPCSSANASGNSVFSVYSQSSPPTRANMSPLSQTPCVKSSPSSASIGSDELDFD